MTSATGHEPSDVATPVPPDVDVMSRDVRWFAHATGTSWPPPGHPEPAPERPDTHVAPALPEAARGRAGHPLPHGTTELLERAPFPHGRPAAPAPPPAALGHALVTAFGLQRREPENPFNDHRPYPSVRARFPVQAFVQDAHRATVLDLHRHALVGLGADPGTGGPAEPAAEVLLAGRYTRLPDSYRWFRGSLVHLEMGIALRQLALGLELFGLRGTVRLPGPATAPLLTALGPGAEEEWSLPLSVGVDAAAFPAADPLPAPGPAPRDDAGAPPHRVDPVLDETVALNRTQEFDGPAEPLTSALPAGGPASPLSWAEVLWRRSAGRMPRGMYGMSGRRRTVPAEVLAETARWLAVPPPGPTLAEIAGAVRVTGVVQGVAGHRDGVHHLVDGRPVLVREDPGAAAELEAHYGYRVDPYNGGDIRHATAVWFLSVRPRELVERFGRGAFTAAQYVAGWQSQGISLAAAAAGLYARPARAFREIPSQRVLGLPADEMVLCTVITGTPRYRGLLCDLRI